MNPKTLRNFKKHKYIFMIHLHKMVTSDNLLKKINALYRHLHNYQLLANCQLNFYFILFKRP